MARSLAAFLLLVMLAAPLLAGGYLLTGMLTVSTEEVVTVQPITVNVEPDSYKVETYPDTVVFDFTKGGFQGGEKILIGCELILKGSEVFQAFKSLTVEILDPDRGFILATLTMANPASDFLTVTPTPPSAESYDVRVTWQSTSNPPAQVELKLDGRVRMVDGIIGAWLDGWKYRKSHELTGSTAGSVTNYQVRFTVHYGSGTDNGENVYLNGKCQPDFEDLRFTLEDGQTLLSYWVESKVDGDYAKVWVKIPSIPASPGTATIYLYYGNPNAYSLSDKWNTFQYFMEVWRITLPRQSYAGEWFTFNLQKQFPSTPVIIAEPDQTFNGGQPLRIRLRNISTSSFEIRQQEPSNCDDIHISEDVTYLAVPPGNWRTCGGWRIEAQTFTTEKWLAGDAGRDRWNTVSYSQAFPTTPLVLSQIQDYTYTGCAHTRERNISTSTFQVSPEPEGSVTTPPTTTVQVGWVAVEPHVGTLEAEVKSETGTVTTDENWLSFSFQQSYPEPPNILAWMQTYNGSDSAGVRGDNLSATGFSVKVEEDTTYDSETGHVNEDIGYLAAASNGDYALRIFIEPEPGHGSWGAEESFS